MTSKRRKPQRKGSKRRGPVRATGSVRGLNSGPGQPPAGLSASARGSARDGAPAPLSQRHGTRIGGAADADAGRFLSPEQQFLLKRRREVEQREAKRRRSLTGLALAVTAVAAGAVWAALRL